MFFLFLIFLFAVTKLEYGLLEFVEDGAGESWDDFGKEFELLFLLVCGKERFGGFAHMPVDFGKFLLIEILWVGRFLKPFKNVKLFLNNLFAQGFMFLNEKFQKFWESLKVQIIHQVKDLLIEFHGLKTWSLHCVQQAFTQTDFGSGSFLTKRIFISSLVAKVKRIFHCYFSVLAAELDSVLDEVVWVLIWLEVFYRLEVLTDALDKCLKLHGFLVILFGEGLLNVNELNWFSQEHLKQRLSLTVVIVQIGVANEALELVLNQGLGLIIPFTLE